MNLKEEFFKRHKNKPFPHANDLFARLEVFSCDISGGLQEPGLPCATLAKMCQIRSEYAKERENPSHRAMYDDFCVLHQSFEKSPLETGIPWIFTFDFTVDNSSILRENFDDDLAFYEQLHRRETYSIFEKLPSQEIAGCIVWIEYFNTEY